MTKDQKVAAVLATVQEAQRFFTREEYVSMFNAIWDGLTIAKTAATDGAPQLALPGVPQ